AANAAVRPTHNSAPVTHPASGPNATSTYAYTPPVSDTLLPADAKQMTMRIIATAHTRYARGAAAPNDPATADGKRKMPAPMVTFTIPAASADVPIARTSDASAPRDDAGVIGVGAPNVGVPPGAVVTRT